MASFPGGVAAGVGAEIARRNWTVVYGGGKVGLMGVLADAALAAGGRVVGVIPRFLYEWEVGHDGLTELEIVSTLTERKVRMGTLADAFLTLPGGIGTSNRHGSWETRITGLSAASRPSTNTRMTEKAGRLSARSGSNAGAGQRRRQVDLADVLADREHIHPIQ